MKKKISICIPCYNEEKNIEKLYPDLIIELEKNDKYEFEIIFEDNDSTDQSQKILKEIAKEDKRVKLILNKKNVGPMKNGAYIMFQATGDAVIGFPCDLQTPVNILKDYIDAWEKGYEVVLGQIASSKERSLMFFMRSLYYKIIDICSDTSQLDHVTGAGLFDKSVIKCIQSLGEPNPNFRYIITELGFNYKLIPYEQKNRVNGRSSYNIWKYLNQAIDSFVEVCKKPIRMATIIGAIGLLLNTIVGIGVLIFNFIHGSHFTILNSVVIFLLIEFGFLHLFFIGLIGEYLKGIMDRIVKRPLVLEKERINFENQSGNIEI